jgi:hypothetical protein
MAVEDAAADDVSGGVIVALRGGDDEARVARQQGSEADLGLLGCWLGRALSRPVEDRRDRSAERLSLPREVCFVSPIGD